MCNVSGKLRRESSVGFSGYTKIKVVVSYSVFTLTKIPKYQSVGGDRGFRTQFGIGFLAPTGAQEVTICVRPSVRPLRSNLSRAVNLHHSGSNLQAIGQEKVSSQLEIREHSKSTQRALRASK